MRYPTKLELCHFFFIISLVDPSSEEKSKSSKSWSRQTTTYPGEEKAVVVVEGAGHGYPKQRLGNSKKKGVLKGNKNLKVSFTRSW